MLQLFNKIHLMLTPSLLVIFALVFQIMIPLPPVQLFIKSNGGNESDSRNLLKNLTTANHRNAEVEYSSKII